VHSVKAVKYVSGYKLLVEFDNGVTKRVDLGKHLDGEVFDSLKDLDYFKTVRVSADLGTIVWANDADFAPEFLYEIGVAVAGPARAGRLGVRRGRKRGGRTGAATKGTGKA
jgi:hypothetical protein